MGLERIDKIISGQGAGSRSQVKELIRRGAVTVNGTVLTRPEQKCDPETDRICVQGEELCFRRNLYLMMNKPAGVLSASRDSRAQTVLDLLPPAWRRSGLFPAGRLDKDTTGLLLITDDGDLAHRMLSPRQHVYKLYLARCDRDLTAEDEEAFAKGLSWGEVQYLPAALEAIGGPLALVEICEGKFHQVKNMFQAVGAQVHSLRRLRIGELELDPSLPPGGVRELTREETALLVSRKKGFDRANICAKYIKN